MILAYTGTRFRQLQAWQAKVMHPSLYGGVQGRSMTSISNGLRLDIDTAQASNQHLIGIKLDQSKCFDRLVPAIAGAFMLALGIPKGIVNVFLLMYKGLHKHLSYRGWISKQSVTNANGVAQGCSFSLIAINVYMHIWATFIEHIPHVTSRVFIDDAYFWVHINNVDDLVQALLVTEQWGTVVGQKLNHSKSVLWATSAIARKLAKLRFPSLPLFLEFDVLGAKIYTSDRENFMFDQKKLFKVVADIRNIANLPVARKTKELLIGCKVLPQISFASHISKIPKRALEKMQSEIAQVFWSSRPHWRSKMLVFALLTKAFRVEPTCSRACSTILEFWRFIHAHPERVQQCCDLLRNHVLSKHSLLARVQDALALFRLQLSDDGFLVFATSRFHILEIGVKDIKPLLHNLCAQWCYERAADQSRKDLAKSTGFLDLALYKAFQQNYSKPFDKSLDLTVHFESQSVGCTITRDRRAAAGFWESKLCRFCNSETESLRRLLTDCPGPLPHEQPPLHELGPNFQLLGLVDHPVGIAKHRLAFSSIQGDSSPVFLGEADARHVWTDGSVILAESYWLTSAAYSIIDASGNTVDSGPVQSPKLSSYSAELFAVYKATILSNTAIVVHTDCKTVVDQFQHLLHLKGLKGDWCHPFWWQAIWSIIEQRQHVHPHPVRLVWIPAHVADDLDDELITDQLAQAHNTTKRDILLNRIADKIAKETALLHAPVLPEDFKSVQKQVFRRQIFLARWNRTIGLDVSHECAPATDAPAPAESHSPVDLRARFPRWDWTQSPSLFTWTSSSRIEHPQGWLSKLDPIDLKTFFDFTTSLQWRVSDDLCTSYVEFAFLSWKRGFILRACSASDKTFRDLTFWLRRTLVFINMLPNHGIFPGLTDNVRLKTEAKALPQGAIVGAIPRFALDELHEFASLCNQGCSKHLSTWEFPL